MEVTVWTQDHNPRKLRSVSFVLRKNSFTQRRLTKSSINCEEYYSIRDQYFIGLPSTQTTYLLIQHPHFRTSISIKEKNYQHRATAHFRSVIRDIYLLYSSRMEAKFHRWSFLKIPASE